MGLILWLWAAPLCKVHSPLPPTPVAWEKGLVTTGAEHSQLLGMEQGGQAKCHQEVCAFCQESLQNVRKDVISLYLFLRSPQGQK